MYNVNVYNLKNKVTSHVRTAAIFHDLKAGLTRSQYHLYGPGNKIVYYFIFKCVPKFNIVLYGFHAPFLISG
jgi:hypothetical protein